jgi:restriction endonuclease Mrr
VTELSAVVRDWGGFEKLVAQLHETGDVKVEHDALLVGNVGEPRQIDVLVRHTQGLYEHLILIECKHWKRNVSRLHVDALKTVVSDLRASKGVIFTTKGFQKGALTAAKSFGIDLFKVREFTDDEWGMPGRLIDFYIQYFQPSIGNLQINNAMATGRLDQPIALTLSTTTEGKIECASRTPTLNADGSDAKTLEEIVVEGSRDALKQFVKQNFLLDGEKTEYKVVRVTVRGKEPYTIRRDGVFVRIPEIEFDLGVKITQSRVQHDRATKFRFALAVENVITGKVAAASREKDALVTEMKTLNSTVPSADVLKNGSIMKITVKGFFPFEEIPTSLLHKP